MLRNTIISEVIPRADIGGLVGTLSNKLEPIALGVGGATASLPPAVGALTKITIKCIEKG